MATDAADPWNDFSRDGVYHDAGRRVIPLSPWHLEWLGCHTDQFEPWLDQKSQREAVADRQHSFCVTNSRHELIAAGGIQPFWRGYGLAWVVLRRDLRHDMVGLARLTTRWLDTAPYHRVEAAVRVGFEPGHRFMCVLGFQREGLMRRYTADQEDAILYARIRDV